MTKKSYNKFYNSLSEETHHETIHFNIEENAIKVISDDTLMFSKPVTITDNTEMWSGAKYDIESLDISQYRGKLTADHRDIIQNVLGSVIGLKKVQNRRVTIDGLKLAVKENPLADYAKRMMMAGHLTDFSIETVGPWPDDNGVFKNAKLVGLSLVVTGNNKQAHINKIAEQTMQDARANGLDTTFFAQALKLPIDNDQSVNNNNIMKFKKVINSRGFAIVLKYKNAAGEDTEVTLSAGKSVDVPDTDENRTVENQITSATEPQKDTPKTTEKETQTVDVESIVKNAIETATKPLLEKVEQLEKTAFDNGAQEPQFTRVNTPKVISELSSMDYRDRHGAQINYAWDFLMSKGANSEAGRKLNEINKYHFEVLKEKGIARNSMAMSDFGNFVISPELLTTIEGFRSDFAPFLSDFNFVDTLSLQMAWLRRNGDINMQEVGMEPGVSGNGNLKPLTDYEAIMKTSDLKEVAGVTPVCDSATRFLAADMLGDISEGYRTDYDRKKAQILIARFQQAVNETGLVVHYNTGTAGGGTNVNALQSYMDAGAAMQEDVMNAKFYLSQASYWELMKRQAAAGINTDSGFAIFTKGPDGSNLMFGAPYKIVPNELLPKLGSSQTRTFTVEGQSIIITSAIFYADPRTVSARTSGGLKYDMSTEAAYEDNGVVKSAFQRNELLLRGSFFRGAAVRDINKVVGLEALNLS